MISSNAIIEYKRTIRLALKDCDKTIDGLHGSWEGASYNSLVNQFNYFYTSTISFDKNMDSFMNALNLYKKYKEKKQSLMYSRNALNTCSEEEKSSLNNRIAKLDGELEDLATEIREKLSSITGTSYSSSNVGNMFNSLIAEGLKKLDPENFPSASNIVDRGDYMCINADFDDAIKTFGGQLDSSGVYGSLDAGDECDNYARLYDIYIQTGKIPSFVDIGTNADGMMPVRGYGNGPNDDRKGQAEYAYKHVKEKGTPCIVHVCSPTGRGHWLCVVGYKKGVTQDNVEIGDLLVLDSAAPKDKNGISASVRYISDNPVNCEKGTGNCGIEPGYQVFYYKDN